jgi:ubiquinone/menaquinone biosynthesis C-methylase UbiE
VRRRERVLEAAGIELEHAVIDLGARPGLLAFGAIERAPLGRTSALAPDAPAAERLRERARTEEVDRILTALPGDLSMIPVGDAVHDRAVGDGALVDRPDRDRVTAELFRILKPGGKVVLHEPLHAERRPLSSEVDLRPLGEETARKVRETEEEAYRDPDDPRMTLTAESLAALLAGAGFTGISAERTLEVPTFKVTPEELVRWFSTRPDGRKSSYEERLLRRLTPDELAAYRRLLEEKLLGRALHRPQPGILVTAVKPT